jgi:hypothetical protein
MKNEILIKTETEKLKDKERFKKCFSKKSSKKKEKSNSLTKNDSNDQNIEITKNKKKLEGKIISHISNEKKSIITNKLKNTIKDIHKENKKQQNIKIKDIEMLQEKEAFFHSDLIIKKNKKKALENLIKKKSNILDWKNTSKPKIEKGSGKYNKSYEDMNRRKFSRFTSKKKTIQNRKDNIVDKINNINNLIYQINILQNPKKKEIGVQKNFEKYKEMKLSSLTLFSIMKESANNLLFQKKVNLYENLIRDAKSEMTKFLIKEIISMIQEQLLFEEILIILKEQNVDLENLFLVAYNKLGIELKEEENIKLEKRKNNCSTKSLISESLCSVISNKIEEDCMKKKSSKQHFFLDLKNINDFDSDVNESKDK